MRIALSEEARLLAVSLLPYEPSMLIAIVPYRVSTSFFKRPVKPRCGLTKKTISLDEGNEQIVKGCMLYECNPGKAQNRRNTCWPGFQDILVGMQMRIVESGRRMNFASALRLWIAVRKKVKM
jgi:hypothetical protein